jgi:hypothetical protein
MRTRRRRSPGALLPTVVRPVFDGVLCFYKQPLVSGHPGASTNYLTRKGARHETVRRSNID